MASTGEPCCGHDHVGGDELWLTVGELRDLVRSVVLDVLDEQDGTPAGQRRLDAVDRRIGEVQTERDRPRSWRERMWS